MSDGGVPEPAMRFRIAQSWWIASELMRRHSGLKLIETNPGGGQYDCLSIVSVQSESPQTVMDLNRVGRIHIHKQVRHAQSQREPITWTEVMACDGPRDMVEEIEQFADFGSQPAKTRTSASNIGFRLAAELLQRGVNDRERWDARNEYADTSGYGGGANGYVQKFAGSRGSASERRPDDLLGIPGYRYWALFRSSSIVAVVDTDGMFHCDAGSLDLNAMYEARGRRWGQTVDDLLTASGIR